MISNKLKTRHIRTTHSVAMKRIASRLQAVPEEKLTEENKRFLANFADEQKGIKTIADVHERIAENAATQAKTGEGAIADGIQEQKKVKKVKPEAKRGKAKKG